VLLSAMCELSWKGATIERHSVELGRAWGKKLKHEGGEEKKWNLVGWQKKILSCKLCLLRCLLRLARVYFFCAWFVFSVLRDCQDVEKCEISYGELSQECGGDKILNGGY